MPTFKRYKYDEWAAFAHQRAQLSRPNRIAIDTETEGFAWGDKAFCVTITWRNPATELESYYLDLDFDESGTRRHIVKQLLAEADVWVFHNAKFDLQKLDLMGCLPDDWRRTKTIEDTNIIHALLDENDRHGLKYLAGKLLGETTNEDKILAKVRRKLKIKKDDGYHLLPRCIVAPYALKDTEFTLRLFELLRPKLPEDLVELYDAEIQTALALLDIEANGIALDIPYLEKTTSEYGVKLMKLDIQLQKLAVDQSVPKGERKVFNPNSVPQIKEAFERMGAPIEATDKAALQAVIDYPGAHAGKLLAKTLLEYRSVKKLHGTYLTGMLAEQVDGIIHPNFNLTLPRTGRMSSSAASNN